MKLYPDNYDNVELKYSQLPQLTPYYAIGLWAPNCEKMVNGKLPRNQLNTVFRVDDLVLRHPAFSYLVKDETILQSPTQEENWYEKITKDSGVFSFKVSYEIAPLIWEKIYDSFQNHLLGYGFQFYALPSTDIAFITIHVEDSFDLKRIGEIAWEINRIMQEFFDNTWKETVRYYTDFTSKQMQVRDFEASEWLKTIYHYHTPGVQDPLYTMPVRYFFNQRGLLKPQEAYVRNFVKNNLKVVKLAKLLLNIEDADPASFDYNDLRSKLELRPDPW